MPGVSLNLLSQVDAGELDLAIMIHPPFNLPKDLNIEVIAREPFVLITAKDVPGDDPLQILREQPFVRYDRGSFGGRQVTQFLKEHKIQTQQALELDELDAIVRMVQSGLGVSLVPMAGLWLEHGSDVRVLRLDTLTFYREIVLLTKYTQRQLPLFALFRACVVEVLGAPK